MGLFDIFKRKNKEQEINIKQDKQVTTKDKIKTTQRSPYQINVSLLKLYKVYRTDSLIKQVVALYTELQLQNGFVIKSTDSDIENMIMKRIHEIEYNSNSNIYELIRDGFKNFVAFGNAMYVFSRNKEKTSGKEYKYNNQQLQPISGIFVQHPLTIQIERNQFGEVSQYKQDLGLLLREYNFFIRDPELNITNHSFSSVQRNFDKYNVAHIAYDYDILTGFGRPFYFEQIDDIMMLRKLEMVIEQIISEGKLQMIMYNVGNDTYPVKSQKDIEDAKAILENGDPYGIVIQPHNHKINVATTNILTQILEFYDRVRSRVYGQLGLSSVMMGEAGQANRATAEVSIDTSLIKTREMQKLFAAQFQHEVLEHIVLDCGLNPKELGSKMPKLEFNDPDIDYMIKLKTHAVYLFEHSVASLSEVRHMLGFNTKVDDKDMYTYRVKLPGLLSTAPDKTKETENLLNPQNQHTGRVN